MIGDVYMKLTYLGTAAAEGFPAVFCNCKYCIEARKLKGKNIRTRSQSLVNDDLLIDIPPDTYMHFLQNNIEAHKIKYLIITHSHSDHFYYDELKMRHSPFAHDMSNQTLEIFCSQSVYNIFQKNGIHENTKVTLISPYEKLNFGDYTITGLPARHMNENEALIYIIQSDKTILYAHDTGYFYDEVFEYIKNNNIKLDMISLDCTHVNTSVSDQNKHMGLENTQRLVYRLSKIGAVSNKSLIYINHFSHNANPLHHLLENMVEDMGFKVSYDGLTVEI